MKYYYFIDCYGVIHGVPFELCDSDLKKAYKIAPKGTEYIGTNKDSKELIEWLRIFFPEEVL